MRPSEKAPAGTAGPQAGSRLSRFEQIEKCPRVRVYFDMVEWLFGNAIVRDIFSLSNYFLPVTSGWLRYSALSPFFTAKTTVASQVKTRKNRVIGPVKQFYDSLAKGNAA